MVKCTCCGIAEAGGGHPHAHIWQLQSRRDIPGLINLLYSTNSEDIIGAAEAPRDLGDRLAVEALVIVFRNPLMPDTVRRKALAARHRIGTLAALKFEF